MLAGMVAGHRPQVVFLAAERAEQLARALNEAERGGAGDGRAISFFPVTERVAGKITTMETTPDVMAVFPLPERPPAAHLVRQGDDDLIVYADGIADPGNMGTLARAAAAFGAAALATSPGSTDLFGPKTVRASMGAIFGLRLLPDVRLGELVAGLGLARVYGLAAHGGTPVPRAALRRPAALVVGAERAGLSSAAARHITELITIPLTPTVPGVVESLNAGVAGAIALYEFSRRTAGSAAPRAREGASTPAAASAKG